MACYKDRTSEKKIDVALTPQAISSDTTTNGEIIDTADYGALTFVLFTDAVSAGDVQALIQDGDDSGLSDAAAVADDFLIGTEAGTNIDAAHSIVKIGYVGKKRYVRLSAVTDNSANLTVGAIAIQEEARKSPVAQAVVT